MTDTISQFPPQLTVNTFVNGELKGTQTVHDPFAQHTVTLTDDETGEETVITVTVEGTPAALRHWFSTPFDDSVPSPDYKPDTVEGAYSTR